MKKILYIIAFTFMLASCGAPSDKSNDSHTHGDGSVHSNDHQHDSIMPHGQENFEVEDGDTVNESGHDHDHDHEHPHNQ